MTKFYIKKIIAYGNNKTDSSIEFSPELTIICGASNTGKTYIFKCIKYLFGSDNLEIETKTGFTKISMILCIKEKDIIFTREINSNDIEVKSNYDEIKDGIYSTDYEQENNINSIYLKLFGIDDEFKVPFNKQCEMKRFTLKMFLHMLMICEKEIIRDSSIILPKEKIIKTYFLSHLLYLIYETEFSTYDPKEYIKTDRISKGAISKYINEKINKLNKRSEEIKNNPLINSTYDINIELKLLTDRLFYIKNKIDETFINGQSLLKDITERNDRLNECNMLLDRYVSLESQYISDIERLTFISESSCILTEHEENKQCPHCNKIITSINEFNVNIDTINAEIFRITSQLDGLSKTKNNLLEEINSLNNSLKELQKKKDELNSLINTSLKPEQKKIEEKIKIFKDYISIESELKTLDSFSEQCNEDLLNLSKKQPRKKSFNPNELFDNDFITDVTRSIQTILKLCDYPNPEKALFNLKDFDIMIDNNPKSTNGKGFTAFYNMVVLLAFRKYFFEKAKIKPPFYIIDTPLFGLDVGKTHLEKNNLIKGIYEYFINTTYQSQLIIIDNEKDLPEINYERKNIIKYNFTHDKDKDRYGFLLDYYD